VKKYGKNVVDFVSHFKAWHLAFSTRPGTYSIGITSSAIRILGRLPRRNRPTLRSKMQRNWVTPDGVKSFSSGRLRMNEKFENGYKMVTLNEKGCNQCWLTPWFKSAGSRNRTTDTRIFSPFLSRSDSPSFLRS
jgi:hypothetical protein